MVKHILKVEDDYDFVLIGISSHEKEYRVCWALNKVFNFEFTKNDSLEIKGKKQSSPSFFSLFKYENEEEFKEYYVLANLSENKSFDLNKNSLFTDNAKGSQSTENEYLIPEYKQMNYFLLIKGEVGEDELELILSQLRSIDLILAIVELNVKKLKSKNNLIF